ncbi:hypothetical protein NUW58_g8297 [Xylaria curta]|uniref:Uncharacterized protein n=1 Tax=Xylaria curta TaxID=42375 RepID=A0ACC1N9T5_9PEZI|nr:hypothetical protein NUW58_g8297 [Xylaria curta]
MKFQEKSSLQATYLLFTAIENEGAVSIQIKMNAVNAKSFLKEVERVQLQLRSLTSPTDGPALTPPSKPSPDPHKGDKETVQSPGSS